MRTWLALLFFAGGSILAPCSPLRGQELEAPPSDPVPNTATTDALTPGSPKSGSTGAVQEVEPRGLYLRDKRGDLVYVPDYSYEKFDQLLKEQRNLANPLRPAFSMKVMTITGEVLDDRFESTVEFTIEGLPRETAAEGSWFRVPLRFDKAYLREEPTFEGPGRHFLTYDEGQGGYICWLQMSVDAVYRITLPLSIPVNRVGEESRFTLQAPSPLASTLTVTVPENPAEGTFQELSGNADRPLAFTVNAQNQGVFSTRAIRGDVVISWHESRAAEEETNVRLDVFGTIVVTADELLQEVRSDGRFVVRGFGGAMEVFQVRLPPGMRLRDTPEPGYKVRPVPTDEEGSEKGQLVEVRLDRATSNEVHIRLAAELPSNQDDPAWPLTVSKLVDSSLEFMPARFEFQDAARHRGQIDLVVKGDWSLFWVEDAALPRTNTNGKSAADGLTARFRYHNQTQSLGVWIRQQPARITVEPTYDVYIDAQQARLFASLACRTSGSKAGSLKFSLPGWNAEIVSFADVDSTLPIDMSSNTLIIPIPAEAQASGRFNLQIEARQKLTSGVVSSSSPLKIVLPTVAAENPIRTNLIVSPATVTMIPADNILLTPHPQNMQALSELITPIPNGALPPPPGAVAPPPEGRRRYEASIFRYRDRGASEQAVFVGGFKIQPQSISVSVASTVTVEGRSYGIEQRLSYRVLHEPVDMLELAVPASLVNNDRGSLRILLDDEPLTPSFSESTAGQRVPVRVRLPQPMLGPIELRVIHPRQPIAELTADETIQLSVPLVFAAAGGTTNTTVIGNTLTILHQDPMRVDLASGAWTVTESESGPGKLVLTTASDGSDAALNVSLSGQGLTSSTILDQIWIQSYFTDTVRRDRAVFRVRTSEPELRVRLPHRDNLAASAVEVAVDHHKVDASPLDKYGEITFAVPAADIGEPHVIELWYRLELSDRSPGTLSLHPPSLDGVDHVERCYWQIVLPRNEIILWGNQAQLAELQWHGWDGWQRTPLREQEDLERWIGAVRQDPVPPSVNTYLFTSFGAPQQLAVITGSRTLVLLGASGIALTVGLLLIYLPVLRHPALLFAAGILSLVLALVTSELAVLIAQAASLGVVLTLLARLLRSALMRATPVTATVQGRTQFSDSKMMELRYSRTDGSSKITTASAPIAVQSSSAESKS